MHHEQSGKSRRLHKGRDGIRQEAQAESALDGAEINVEAQKMSSWATWSYDVGAYQGH